MICWPRGRRRRRRIFSLTISLPFPGGTLPAELSRVLRATDGPERADAWQAFVAIHSRLLLHVARSVTSDHDEAMDAYTFQLEQLSGEDFQRLRTYELRERTKFSTWLVVVARRLCIDHHRQRYGRVQRATGSETATDSDRAVRRRLIDLAVEEIDIDTLNDTTGETPETNLRVEDLRLALDAALAGLEPRERLLLTLRFEDGLSAAEIARVMLFPTPFHVYRRLSQVLEGIRCKLTSGGIDGAAP